MGTNKKENALNTEGEMALAELDSSISDFFVVGIGASDGSVEALEQFFENMPSDSNMAFVIIQNLNAEYKSYMSEILKKHTDMPVHQIQDGMQLLPRTIYTNQSNSIVQVCQGQFELMEQSEDQPVKLVIDAFLDSLARERFEKSIAVILSGDGSDGTHGSRIIKEVGGIVIGQEEKTARYMGMPRSVIATKICDYILPPAKMPEKLLKYTGQLSLAKYIEIETQRKEEAKESMNFIYNILKKQFAIDFSLYKQSTVLRCIERRMRINQITSFYEYVAYLKEELEEVDALFNSLLIGVTRFFRDREAFEIIKKKVIPEIVDSKAEGDTIRIWVAGCSTGEEAYSLAILFREYMNDARKNINIKIFATDIDRNAIEYASKGLYPDSISEDMNFAYLSRYFTKNSDTYQITKNIRDMVIFSTHNVISNPPFHKIHLVSCRNLLIYFQPELQARVLSTFQFALETRGFMFLGISETTGGLNGYFSTVDSKWKIYRCKETKKRPLMDGFSVISTGMRSVQSKTVESYFSHKIRNNLETDDIYARLIEECLPPSVIVDENGELIQVCGEADKYLRVPRGRAYYDIQKMVPKELSAAIGTAISRVKKDGKSVSYTNIQINLGEGKFYINLVVKPLDTKRSGPLILVMFEESTGSTERADHTENFDTISKLHERIGDLEQELQYTKDSLQASIEEIEASSEELQSTNEELLVSNEELHSTNEELQSVNEELMVVNNQYQYKIQELADLNNDMINFLNSTSIGTIFLDSNLCIKRFTPAIAKEINLMEQDIGRPIGHISHNLKSQDLISLSEEVLKTSLTTEKEVQSTGGKFYIIRCAPYRTNENSVEGVVISLVDITARKEVEDKLRQSKDKYQKLVELSPYAILILKDNIIQYSNEEGVSLLQVESYEQLIGKPLKNFLSINEAAISRVWAQSGNEDIIPLEEQIIRKDGSTLFVEVMFIPTYFEDESTQLVIIRDITFRKLSEQLKEENTRKERLLKEAAAFDEMKNEFFSNLSHELRTPLNVIMSTIQLFEFQLQNNNMNSGSLDVRKYIKIMKQNCFRQLRLVNNMLDITKMDAGFYQLNVQNHEIVNIIRNIASSVSEYVKNQSINLVFTTEVANRVIACDPDSIERIMLNLLSNAVKFTKAEGNICVRLYEADHRFYISVKDMGIGIPMDKQEIIFDRFRQVDKSLTRNHEGSGIGLSLVKALVEMQGGNISVRSELGQGAEFIVELPIRIVPYDDYVYMDKYEKHSNVEKIYIEFSDIYSLS
jgi:two-component system CheB/CheR fusion protein